MNEKFCEDALKRYGQLKEQKGREKGREKGRKEREEERNYEIANDLIQIGLEAEEVSSISHLDINTVNQLIQNK